MILNIDWEPPPPVRTPTERQLTRHLTPLYIPPDLTQKAPNREPVKKELTIAAIAPRPIAPKPVAQRSIAPPPPTRPQAAPKQIQVEPPKIEAAAPNLPVSELPKAAPLPPPPAATPPKLALEEVNQHNTPVGKPTGAIQMPGNSVADALRNVTRSTPSAGITVYDAEERPSAFGLNLPPSAGRPRSSLELKSDPMGVDFRGYMTQVLAAVRRSWFAVYPEAARLGQRGQVSLQFAIAKQGGVNKVVFSHKPDPARSIRLPLPRLKPRTHCHRCPPNSRAIASFCR